MCIIIIHYFSHSIPPPYSQSLEGDEVVWVGLAIVEHNIHVGVVYIIHYAVEAVVGLQAPARRRNPHVALTQSVVASQDSGHKH